MGLPDFKRTKMRRKRALWRILHAKWRYGDHLLSKLRTFRQPDAVAGMVSGEEERVTFNDRLGAVLRISMDELPDLDNDRYVDKIMEMAGEFRKQAHIQFFKTVDALTEKYGMVVKGQGRPLREQFLEGIGRIQVEFDESGPIFPTLCMHPDMADQFKAEMAVAESDPDYRQRFDEIVARKYVEWRDREANRRLVD
jgi:hypothetical protein